MPLLLIKKKPSKKKIQNAFVEGKQILDVTLIENET